MFFVLINLNAVLSMDDVGEKAFERHTKLSDPDVLKPLLLPEFRMEPTFSKVVALVESRYEVAPRGIHPDGNESKYGILMCMNPETVAYTMRLSPGKTVLELAGADGSLATLFAFAGAKRSLLLDFNPKEVALFEQRKASLPEVADQLESVCCSVFDILKERPDLISQVDIIYAGNFLHFFTDKEQNFLFSIIKSLLKPKGRIIFTTNGLRYPTCVQTPFLTRRTVSYLFIQSNQEEVSLPLKRVQLSDEECSEDLDPKEYQKLRIYMRHPNMMTRVGSELKNNWVAMPEAKQLQDVQIRKKIDAILKEEKKLLRTITFGSIFFHKSTSRIYSPEALGKLVSDHGFENPLAFHIGKNGHILLEVTPNDLGDSAGVIAVYNPPPDL
ncbi:MAG: class I SAM-dependent methyltransferase [Alphaproteobacteria bacterium]|nr:class I SAM-dependent methyltransferase [Alphaproteobacteria bacterium]